MKIIKVTGISEKGTQKVYRYMASMYAKNDFDAITDALRWADREYTCEYDENGKPIHGSTYKEFAEIVSIEVIEE